MTVEMLIEELKKCDPKARVMMHCWDGEEVLFTCWTHNGKPSTNVWFESFDDLDLEEELKAELEHAIDITDDEADFYALWLERGITPGVVYDYLGKEAAWHMIEVCREHGLM